MRARALILVACAWPLAAADPVAALIDQARATPAEIFADVVFHLIDGNRIPDKERLALLDEVFLRAGEAVLPTDSRPAALSGKQPPGRSMALGMHLDALSIRCRVVRALLPIDSKRARERFAQIPAPDVPKPDCASAEIPDPTVYFDTLADLAARGAPFAELTDAVRGAQSSLEIVDAARAFPQLVHTEKEAATLASAFITALAIDDSNRTFSAALWHENLVGAVLAANDKLAARGAPRQPLLTALRSYLVHHLTAPRCADSSADDYARSIDAFRVGLGKDTAVPPITDQESTPAKIEGEAAQPKPFSDPDFEVLNRDIDALVVNPDKSGAADLLARVGAWKADAGLGFHRKVRLYLPFLTTAFPDDTIRAAAAGYFAVLEDSAILASAPVDWLAEVQTLSRMREVRNLGGGRGIAVVYRAVGGGQPASPLPFDTVQLMADSSFSALALYGRLAQLDRPAQR